MESTSDQERPPFSAEEPRLVRKPVELICCAPGQSLSFTQRRIITAICDSAMRFQNTDEVFFTPRELSLALYNGGENLGELHKASNAMRDLKAWLNPLEAREPPETLGVFEGVSCSKEEILYRLNPKICQLIRAGETFAEVDPLVEKKLAAVNAVALYELAALFMRRRVHPTYSTGRWRQLITGSSTQENQRFLCSHIVSRSNAALERHARTRLTVVRPRGPRVDLVRLEFRRLSKSVAVEVAQEAPLDDAHRDADSPAQGNGEQSVARHPDGVDAFAQLLDSWNSQFGAAGPHVEILPDAPGPARDSHARGDPEPQQCSDVVGAWQAARDETGRIKAQLQLAERLERDAALRALRAAVQRYQVAPEEVFGARGQNEGVGALGGSVKGIEQMDGDGSVRACLG